MFGFFKKKKEYDDEKSADLKSSKTKITRLTNDINRLRLKTKERYLENLKARMEEIELEQEIAEMEEMLDDYNDEIETPEQGLNPEMLFSSLMAKALQGKNQNSPQTPTQTPAKLSYSNEQLNEFKKKIPAAQLKALKMLPDDEVASQIMDRFPDVDDDTIARAVILLKQ